MAEQNFKIKKGLSVGNNEIITADGDLTLPSGASVSINGSLLNSDDVEEGTSNLYYTDARARASISASGDLNYNSGTGEISFSETVTSISLNGNSLDFVDEAGNTTNVDLSAYLDDTTNTVSSASLNGNTITFTREDSTTFDLDVSDLYDDTNLVTSVNGSTGAVIIDAYTQAQTDTLLNAKADTTYVDTEIANIDALPSQTGNAGKLLGTDGTTASWQQAGAVDDIFYENAQVITSDYTLAAGRNAMTAGSITINDGVTITISDGSSWTIV